MELKNAIKNSIELVSLALVLNIVTAFVGIEYLETGQVKVWNMIHTGGPAILLIAVLVTTSLFSSITAIQSIKRKLRHGS